MESKPWEISKGVKEVRMKLEKNQQASIILSDEISSLQSSIKSIPDDDKRALRRRTVMTMNFQLKVKQEEMAIMVAEKKKLEEKLKIKLDMLEDSANELQRLLALAREKDQALLDDIYMKLLAFDEERLRILNDPNLSEEERQRLLAELDKALEKFMIDNKDQFEKLYAMKDPREYFSDKYGTYFLLNGQKIYQKNPYSSMYILNADNTWTKFKPAPEISYDERGEYYRNEYGIKVYIREYKFDKYGMYLIDENGKKIYYYEPGGQPFALINGKLVQIFLEGKLEAFGEEELYECESIESDESISKLKQREDVEYIKECVGYPLKKALAQAVVYLPVDPINFIANFLLQYRLTELSGTINRGEIEEIENIQSKYACSLHKNS